MSNRTNVSLADKYRPLLDSPEVGSPIKDPYKRWVVAQVLENTMDAMKSERDWLAPSTFLGEAAIPTNFMGASSSTAGSGGIDTFDPIMISMIRRSVPNMNAYDFVGVQPMTGPTGLIFAMRVRASSQSGAEQWYNEVNTQFSSVTGGANTLGDKQVGTLPGNTSTTANLAANGVYNFGGAMSTAQAEALGTDSNTAFAEMAFSIEKVTATAKSRALRATWTMELAQDLKAIHGMDAEGVLSEMLTTEIMAEINREIVRSVNIVAKVGAQTDTATAGVFDLDTDSNGRWSVEKFKGMHFFIDRECNQIAKDTRRGKGNIMICSSDVASALNAAKVLDYTPEMVAKLGVDDTGSTFVGMIGGTGPAGVKVYIDPYSSGGQYMTLGYKGPTPIDAGLYYCPYVPLQLVRAVDPTSYQPSIGYKTRYAVVANPFAGGLTAQSGVLTKDSNVFYRRVIVSHLM